MFSLRNYTIAISLLVALMLQIMPMPIVADPFRPDWVMLVLAYWTLALPQRVNVGVAFINGLLLDLLLGTTLGIHGFALSLVIFILAANYQRLRNYSVWQQAFMVGLLTSLYHLVIFWLQHLLTDIYFMFTYLWPVLTTMLFWPWCFLILRKVRRQLKVN
ncbi:rod shape-determining protein MreD [Lacimicrobium alkaliphilum]|jgi:rod shape-determining protein MreD|uniref:Rod shape-determining protein MreD n=1 Tax=Lacimicrobium alkaliphilum TaxID=1526571 RepID=A0A0U2Z3G3_9ALTE|nr:rod shape-determining protein MreD [Lacimicrobium alkaliphilum]ALS96996.1 rod shape-determining protein MreD [Lacimicrobium alkaliphilum]